VFGRMKGERRTVIWWGLPLWTVFATAGISVGGMLFLERRDQVDVTEYRLLMRDWPEMHCRAVATAMTFAPGRAEWTLPPEAVVYRSSHDALDGFWKRQESTHSADSFRLRMPRQMSGTLLQLEAGWFAPAHSPITLQLPESKDGVGNDRAVHATEDLDGVYVLHDGQWFGLGAMKAGEKRSLLQGPTQRLAKLSGLPQALHDAVHPWTMGRGCQDPSHNHQLHAVPLTDSIVVAWRRGEVPQVRPVWDNAVTKGRVIWVMQCPR